MQPTMKNARSRLVVQELMFLLWAGLDNQLIADKKKTEL